MVHRGVGGGRVSDRVSDFFETVLGAVFFAAALVCLVSSVGYLSRMALGEPEPRNAWGESAEFAQLATGQERFSEHETNVEGTWVLVDHSTGAQYVVTGEGVCPLLDADGTPLLVAEAGE